MPSTDPAMTDTRIAYGARCTWWDSVSKVGRTGGTVSLPCCPHCGSMLFEKPDEASFLAGVPAYEAAGHPGYGEMVMWGRGKCFRGATEMEAAYRAALQSKDKQDD